MPFSQRAALSRRRAKIAAQQRSDPPVADQDEPARELATDHGAGYIRDVRMHFDSHPLSRASFREG